MLKDGLLSKTCISCGQVKPLTDFYRRGGGRSDYQVYCKVCKNDEQRRYRQEHPEYSARKTAEWRQEHREDVLSGLRRAHLKRLYGLSEQEYLALWDAQHGVCAICYMPCKTERRLSVDHNHKTGRIRGLLCQRCNHVLGLMDESPDRLRRAALYIETYTEDSLEVEEP